MRLFFHLAADEMTILDTDGLEIAGPANFREMSVRALAELIQDFPPEQLTGWQLLIADESGTVLFAVALDDLDELGPQ